MSATKNHLLVVFTSPLLIDQPADREYVRKTADLLFGTANVMVIGHSSTADAWMFRHGYEESRLSIVQFLPNNMRRDYDRPGSDGKRVVKNSNWQGRNADLAMVRAAAQARDKGRDVYVAILCDGGRYGNADLRPVKDECQRFRLIGNEYTPEMAR
jgi:hypothetical protein